jgi:hypothetical protein
MVFIFNLEEIKLNEGEILFNGIDFDNPQEIVNNEPAMRFQDGIEIIPVIINN